MRLYSVQPRHIYDKLMSEGVFSPRPLLQPDNILHDDRAGFSSAYDWLCEQMPERGLPRPASDAYPVWAWQQWWGPAKAKPDLRYASMRNWSGADAGPMVLMTLEVPDDQVLLSDFEAWHFCLNYWFLAGVRAANAFSKRCEARGGGYYKEKPLKDPALHDELVASWQAIFDIPRSRKLLGGRASEQSIQATFWSLQAGHVLEAVEFGAGQRAIKLSARTRKTPRA